METHMASVGQQFTRHPSSSNWSLHLMLFRCWCQNDTALKMSGLKARGRCGASLQELGRRGRAGGGALRLRTARRTLPPASHQSAAVARVG